MKKTTSKHNIQKFFGEDLKISQLGLSPIPAVTTEQKCREVLDLLRKHNSEFLPVTDSKGTLLGIVTGRQITNSLSNFKVKSLDDSIQKALIKDFKRQSLNDPIKYLSKAFNRHQLVLISDEKNNFYGCHHQILQDFILKSMK